MPDAVAEYAQHRTATDRWALARFVVPLTRWNELRSSIDGVHNDGEPWPVSLVAGPTDFDRIADTRQESRLSVQAVECKVSAADDVSTAGRIIALGMELFVEPAQLSAFDDIAPHIARVGAYAKIRTGGVTPDAFPSPQQVLNFVLSCKEAGIRFKATAGLHHAVRGEYRLTYEPAAPTGEMFGFLNVVVAAALVWHNRSRASALAVLEERSMDEFTFTDDGIAWRDERFSLAELDDVRSRFFAGFGSCSFREPMAEIGLEARPRA